MLELVDILRIIGIFSFGMFSVWVIYRFMKSADADEDNEEDKENEGSNK